MRMMKRWLRSGFILPAAAACILSVPIGAQAALVTYSFTGNLNPDVDPLSMFPVSGSFQFDNATGGSGGAYPAVKNFVVTIGGYSSHFAPGANAITISHNTDLGGGVLGDRWSVVSAATGPVVTAGTPPVSYTPFSFDLQLNRVGGGLFTNTNLQDPPSLNGLNGVTGRWRLFFEGLNGTTVYYLGSVTSLTAVPLPAAVLLFGAGLISLVGLGAGGLRNLRGTQS